MQNTSPACPQILQKSTIAHLSGRIMIPVYNTRCRAMGCFLLTVLFFYSSYNNINYQDVACCQAANRQHPGPGQCQTHCFLFGDKWSIKMTPPIGCNHPRRTATEINICVAAQGIIGRTEVALKINSYYMNNVRVRSPTQPPLSTDIKRPHRRNLNAIVHVTNLCQTQPAQHRCP